MFEKERSNCRVKVLTKKGTTRVAFEWGVRKVLRGVNRGLNHPRAWKEDTGASVWNSVKKKKQPILMR